MIKESTKASVVSVIALIMLIAFMAGMWFLADRDHNRRQVIKDGCVKTEMVVLGGRNKSINPVYDCSGVKK